MRISIDADPFPHNPETLPWNGRGQWPCNWVRLPHAGTPQVTAYRLQFNAPEEAVVRLHVTADERYELYLDNVYLGRGSDRGTADAWFFETYDVPLAAGPHVLVARVWALGEQAAYAQHAVESGLLVCPQEEKWQALIGTGKANWETKPLPGYEMVKPLAAWGTGHKVKITGGSGEWRQGRGDGWQPVEVRDKGMTFGANDRNPGHLLFPSMLPAQMEQRWTTGKVRYVTDAPPGPTFETPIRAAYDLPEQHAAWEKLIFGDEPMTVPPHTRKRVLVDLQDYVCAYSRAILTGGKGASVRVHWQESLYDNLEGKEKGNRDLIEGKYFATTWKLGDGVGDEFVSTAAGDEIFEPLWWQAGRYVEVVVTTQDDPLTIENLHLVETRYPYEYAATFEASEPKLAAVIPIMRRALEMCSHETYMDCPFYEQLQYIGDTRLQVLVTYTLSEDDRLPRQALRMFDVSRQLSGLTQSRYPSRVLQIIPPFSLWYVCMVHDFARYRGDMNLVRSLMPGVRGVLDAYRAKLDADGLLGAMEGWNYIDWVGTWSGGMAKDASGGHNSILAFQFALALRKAAQLEDWMGEPEMVQRHERTYRQVVDAANDHYFNKDRGIYANDIHHTEWSEHAQCLALLADAVPADWRGRVVEGLLSQELDRTTIYFSHYLFETYAALGRTDRILARMPYWYDHIPNGLKTTIESPEPTRSDCHAWGAHPAFHYFASILGIRPASPGFREAEIAPDLGGLEWARGTLPTPHGPITVDATTKSVRVVVPAGMSATLKWKGQRIPLHVGENHLS